MDKHARNLFVIAGAITVYLLAGADLANLAVLGIRAPAEYPVVFSHASVVALVWFWWRYQVSWLDSNARKDFRNDYLSQLQQREPYKTLIKKSVDLDGIVKTFMERKKLTGLTPVKFTDYSLSVLDKDLFCRLQLRIHQLGFTIGTSRHEINQHELPDKKQIDVPVPWWFHVRHSPGFFVYHIVRRPKFANQVLPQLVFGFALLLIVLNYWGVELAGYWGRLDPPAPPQDYLRWPIA